MHTTSPTLLQKLRSPEPTPAWERFVELYTPLLLTWARRLGLQSADAADLVQDVFAKLLKELPKFQYDPARKNFRGWLRTVCFNQWRDRQKSRAAHVRAAANDAGLADAEASDDGLHDFWDQEHNTFLVRQAFRLCAQLSDEFEPQTLNACQEVALNQRPVAEVARELGVSENTIYIAKLRVLRRLREELAEFLD